MIFLDFLLFSVEQQTIVELKPDPRSLLVEGIDHDKLLSSTRQILEKIDEVNRKQGMPPKNVGGQILKPFPQSHWEPQRARNYNPFLPQEPFKNPILEYLLNSNPREVLAHGNIRNDLPKSSVAVTVKNVPASDFSGEASSNAILVSNRGPEKQEDHKIPGRVVTRKITHQQTLMVPAFEQQQPFLDENGLMQQMGGQKNPDLENQTVEAIRNIVQNSPLQPEAGAEMRHFLHNNPYYPYYNYPQPQAKQWSTPFQNVFPIIIKNPFQMVFNALTSMVEYGPEADVCAQTASQTSREGKVLNPAPTGAANEEVYVEHLEVSEEPEADEQLELEKPEARVDKALQMGEKVSNSKRRKQVQEEVDGVVMSEKGLFTSDNNKRQANRQNVGSGVFIHRLRVTKGGVAIAGPGGIATAGSGGTAIVGPNGYAYTHPDSLAIAGSGSKVIAVDPSVDLAEIVGQLGNKTGPKKGVSPRFGKLVAVGPVIYYNRG